MNQKHTENGKYIELTKQGQELILYENVHYKEGECVWKAFTDALKEIFIRSKIEDNDPFKILATIKDNTDRTQVETPHTCSIRLTQDIWNILKNNDWMVAPSEQEQKSCTTLGGSRTFPIIMEKRTSRRFIAFPRKKDKWYLDEHRGQYRYSDKQTKTTVYLLGRRV